LGGLALLTAVMIAVKAEIIEPELAKGAAVGLLLAMIAFAYVSRPRSVGDAKSNDIDRHERQ
jgi:hypothetical protein